MKFVPVEGIALLLYMAECLQFLIIRHLRACF